MRKPPPPITDRYLQWVANEYFKKFLTTRAHLRRLLMDRVRRSCAAHGGDPREGAQLVDALLDKLVAAGTLNDAAYTNSKVRSLAHRGASARAISAKLAAKGVSQEAVKESLDSLKDQEGDIELASAVALVRKRRLGPYRDPAKRKELFMKDLGVMARAGFNFDMARKVLMAEDEDALEGLLDPDF